MPKTLLKNMTLQDLYFFMLLILFGGLFFSTINPFVIDIFLSIILTHLFKKSYKLFLKKFKSKTYAAITTIGSVVFLIAIPLMFIAFMVSSEAADNYTYFSKELPAFQEEITNTDFTAKIKSIPYIGEHLDIKVDGKLLSKYSSEISKTISTIATFVFTALQKVIVNAVYIFIHFFIILFLMYYLLIDGDKLLSTIYNISPLKNSDEKIIAKKVNEIVDGILINSFLIGIGEGVFGGILFALTGISSPFFWGVLMFFLSLIPLVGANTILLPAAIIQFFSGNYIAGFVLLIIGVGAILINQNLIRPKLDSKRSGLHPALVFLSGMGGLMWLGIPGFIIGPLVAGLFLVILEMYKEKYTLELEEWNN